MVGLNEFPNLLGPSFRYTSIIVTLLTRDSRFCPAPLAPGPNWWSEAKRSL
jgi:hypothetical protein